MKKLFLFIALILSLMFFGGCSKKEVLVPTDGLNAKKAPAGAPRPDFVYNAGALQINYNAAANLNLYDGTPKTIIAVVYQLSSPDAFMNLSKTKDGLKKLLQAAEFDPSVVSVNSFVVQPNSKKSITTYRAKEATWIGVVGGYYQLTPNLSVSLQKIPVRYDKHWFWPFTYYTTEVLDLIMDIDFYEYSLQTKGYYYELH